MLVTEVGIVTVVRADLPWKALAAIEVTVEGTVRLLGTVPLYPDNVVLEKSLKIKLLVSTYCLVTALSNAPAPIVAAIGITTLIRPVPANAEAPILVTEVGIVTVVRAEAPWKALATIEVTVEGMVRLLGTVPLYPINVVCAASLNLRLLEGL
jgi:hypothetical protein